MSELLRFLQEVFATCTSAEGAFGCTFFIIPAVVLLAFAFSFLGVVLATGTKLAGWAAGRLDAKVCPRCGETVRRRAAICRFCQYAFPDVPPPS